MQEFVAWQPRASACTGSRATTTAASGTGAADAMSDTTSKSRYERLYNDVRFRHLQAATKMTVIAFEYMALGIVMDVGERGFGFSGNLSVGGGEQ